MCFLTSNDGDNVEWQAYVFGGLVPAPEDVLRDRFNDGLRVEKTGVDANSLAKPGLGMICGRLAREFEASRQAVEKRIYKDRLAS